MRTQDDLNRIFSQMKPLICSLETLARKEDLVTFQLIIRKTGAEASFIENIDAKRDKHITFTHTPKVEERCELSESYYRTEDDGAYVKENEDPFELDYLDHLWEEE